MHYGPYDFSVNGRPTLRSRRGLDWQMGNRTYLAESDVATIQRLYFGTAPVPIACRPAYPGAPCIPNAADIWERVRGIGTAVGGLGPYAGVEGATVTFTAGTPEPGLTYSWFFGDADASGAGTATATHAYADNGSFPVLFTLEDAAGERATVSTTATISNAAPSVTLTGPTEIASGQTATVNGGFTDAGVGDAPWTTTLAWASGEAPATAPGTPGTPINASRRLLAAGSYAVTLGVTDKDGGAGTATHTLTVRRLSIAIDVLPDAATRGEPNSIALTGGNGVVPVAVLTAGGLDARAIDPATVTLGDGSGPEAPVARAPNGRLRAALEDVDGDGDQDLVAFVERAALVATGDLSRSTTALTLHASLGDGRQVAGSDVVRVVP